MRQRVVVVVVVVVVVIVVLTLTHNTIQSVVARQAPITLVWKKYLGIIIIKQAYVGTWLGHGKKKQNFRTL